MTGPEPAQMAGWSALVAAVATVLGAVTLVQFFRRGGRWGWWNDVFSVVLMVATMPVALVIASIQSERLTTVALAVAAIGLAGMAIAATSQALLVAGVRSFEQTKLWTLGGGAIVGLWYVLAGGLAFGSVIGGPFPFLAIAAGLGFIAVGYGFVVGNERHPLSALGGGVLFVASLAFLTMLGIGLVTRAIVVPTWNV